MAVTRRLFVRNGGIAMATLGLAPLFGPEFLRNAVFAAEPARSAGGRKTLVCLFQRGAVDGLNMVVPHGDPDYYAMRPTLGIPRTGPSGTSVIDLNGFFGFHPGLAALKPIYDAGHIAVIHAVGSPDPSRSHFDAQDFMESAVPGDKTVATGWLARTIAACPEDRAKITPMRAVSLTSTLPRSLQGDPQALAIPNLAAFGIGGGPAGRAPGAAEGFEALYNDGVGGVLHGAGKDSFDAIRMLKSADPIKYQPAAGVVYPRGGPGNSLRQIAQLVKANVGLEVAFADCGGWDTHVNQGAAQGQLAARLTELGEGLAAFYTDLGDRMDDVVVLTMSEFGRTARENGNAGTDHGHGTCFLALGGVVNGGKVHGNWPGLAREKLNDARDLAVTTDFRDVFSEIAARHMGARDLNVVFPKYTAGKAPFKGILKA